MQSVKQHCSGLLMPRRCCQWQSLKVRQCRRQQLELQQRRSRLCAVPESRDWDGQQPESHEQQQQQQQQQEATNVSQRQQQLQQQTSPKAATAPAEQTVTAARSAETTSDSTAAPAAATMATAAQQTAHEISLRQVNMLGISTSTTSLYTVLAAALIVAGLSIAVFATPIAASALKLGYCLHLHQAAVLMGCFGAAVMRTGSICSFLAEGASLAELCTWRYQRLNVGLMFTAAVCAVLQLQGLAAAQPWLPAVLLAASAGIAAACGAVYWQQAQGPGIWCASAVGYADWIAGLKAAAVYFIRDITSVAGTLMVLLAAVAVGTGLQVVFGPAPAVAIPWAEGPAGQASLQYMRQLLGLGLVLTGLQCWALTECAAYARRLTPEIAVKLTIAADAEKTDLAAGRLLVPMHVPPKRFNLLHTGFFAATVVQGLWLAQLGTTGASVAGMLVNSGDPVWPGLYWTVLGSAPYLATMLACIDYGVIWNWILAVGNYLSGWVSFAAVILFVDWNWLQEVRRK